VKRFLALSRFKQIVFIVIALHFSAIFCLCLHHIFSREKPKSKIIVRTISFPPKVITQAVSVAPKVKKESPKTAAKAPIGTPKPKEKVLTQVKTKEKSIESSLIQEIEKDLADLEKKPTSVHKSSLSLPKEIVAPHVKEETEECHAGYGEILVSYLQNSLELPEMGEVKIDLEIDSLGHVVHFEIIEAKNKKNSDFLKKRLPELTLPCFNNDRKSDETAKFTITFKNRIAR
jgi:hypothetical protein